MASKHDLKTDISVKSQKMYPLAPPKNKVCPGIRSIRIPITPLRKTTEKIKQHFHDIRLSSDTKSISELMHTMYSQAAVEIHISRMYLGPHGIRTVRDKLEPGAVLKLTWEFFTFDKCTTSNIRPEEGNVEIGMTFFYKVDLNEAFITYANITYLELVLKGLDLNKELHLAKGKVALSVLLDEPNTQITNDVELVDSDEAEVLDNAAAVTYYGKVSMWIRLVCTEHHVSNLKSRTAPTSLHSKKERKKSIGKTRISQFLRQQTTSVRNTDPKEDHLVIPNAIDDSSSSGSETDSDIENFQEALDLVLTRNKALRITQSEIAAELKERTKWLHEEYNWKLTLQEYDILRGEDPHLVQWRQWRDKNTSSLKLRHYSSIDEIYKNDVTLHIHSLEFYTYTADWINFPPIEMLYVQCKFLTFEGEEMSTKSIPINKNNASSLLKFNFSKLFEIDVKKDEKICKLLANAIQSRETVEFTLMSEPFEDITKVQCSFKVGTTETSLFDLVQSFEDKVSQTLKFKQLGGEEDEIIGKLHISFDGVQRMRAVALQILSPPDLMSVKLSSGST